MIQAPVATQLWRTVLAGRFRLLDRWCDFVRDTHRTIITEDTWRQVRAGPERLRIRGYTCQLPPWPPAVIGQHKSGSLSNTT
jgi:hypothetical protein